MHEHDNPKLLSPLALAFIGDGIFELMVRERLVRQGNCPVKRLHQRSVEQVCCRAQARFVEILRPVLTEEEEAVYKRGRNANVGHIPKNASPADYHAATGLEALFGYLYLQGDQSRLEYLFSIICAEDPANPQG